MRFHCLTTHAVQEREPDRPRLDGAKAHELVMEACALYGVTKPEIMGASRQRHAVVARYEVMRRMALEYGACATEIGRLMNRDRTTVAYALGKLTEREKR